MNILLGVSASIAIYRSCDLVRELTKKGHNVTVAMTKTAAQWIAPVIFSALSNNEVFFDQDETVSGMPHIKIRENKDVFLIAPATAHLIACAANGLAGDIISQTLLSFPGPRVIAPAMNPHMFSHPATQKNIAILQEYGYIIFSPEKGEVVCGDEGEGKMMAVPEIISRLEKIALK